MATYAISDLHSCMAVWKKVKDYLNEDDVLYVLGDSCDRGPDGIDVLMDLLRRPNTYMIKGNHDEFMIDGIKGMLGNPLGNSMSIGIWFSNGGSGTYDALEMRNEDFLRGLLFQLEEMPTRIDYVNTKGQTVILTHAGFIPFGIKYESYSKYDNKRKLDELYMWNRDDLGYNDWADEYDGIDYSNIYIVHGHSPCIAFGHVNMWTYGEGHMFDIDMGAFYSHKTCLLNLDTFEPKYFFEEGYESLGK